jgi:hypothetical protein
VERVEPRVSSKRQPRGYIKTEVLHDLLQSVDMGDAP